MTQAHFQVEVTQQKQGREYRHENMRRGLVKEKTERAFGRKQEEGGQVNLHPLNVEEKKTLNKMDVDKYKDPSCLG